MWTSPLFDATPPEPTLDDPDLAAVRAELGRERAGANTGLVAVILFGIFVFQGLSEGSLRSLLVLIAVLFFHEAGHALGMLAFGYRDVRIFFLPFFGAAVTGRNDEAAAWQRAVVLLLGPAPGVVLGLALIALSGGAGIVGEVGRMAVYVNLFNLLPFEPLDGGRLLGVTLFSRSRWLEALFGLLGAVALGFMALKMGAWLLAFVAFMGIGGARRRWRIATAAKELKERGLRTDMPPAKLPPDALAAIDAAGQEIARQPGNRYAARAAMVREIHGRIRFAAPGVAATLGLLTAYGAAVLIGLVALVVAVKSHKAEKASAAMVAPEGR